MIMGVDLQGASAGMTQKVQQNSLEQQQKNAEDKEQADALKEFQQVLQKAGQI
jgi:hypothetical protein